MTETLPFVTHFPLVLGGILLVGTILLFLGVRKAEDGSEDENGFHRR